MRIKNVQQILYRIPENTGEIADLMLSLGYLWKEPYLPIPGFLLNAVLEHFEMTTSDLEEMLMSIRSRELLVTSYAKLALKEIYGQFNYKREVERLNMELVKNLASTEQNKDIAQIALEHQKLLEELRRKDQEFQEKENVLVNLIQLLTKSFKRSKSMDQIGFAFDNLYLAFQDMLFLLRASILGIKSEKLSFEEFIDKKTELFQELIAGIKEKFQKYHLTEYHMYFIFYNQCLTMIMNEMKIIQNWLVCDFSRSEYDYLMLALNRTNAEIFFTKNLSDIIPSDFEITESSLTDSAEDLLRYNDRRKLDNAISELLMLLNKSFDATLLSLVIEEETTEVISAS